MDRERLISYVCDHLSDHYDPYQHEIDVVELIRAAMVDLEIALDDWSEVWALTVRTVARARVDYQEGG
jgi:hypothetical protein